jgi:hypothetical protein
VKPPHVLTLTSEPRANVERYEHGAKPRRRAALNDWLETRCRELWNQTPHGSHPGAIAEAWAEEAQYLMQLPRPFDSFG